MDEYSIFYRLYDEKIASDNFMEAQNIIWKIKEIAKSGIKKSETSKLYLKNVNMPYL